MAQKKKSNSFCIFGPYLRVNTPALLLLLLGDDDAVHAAQD